MLGTFSYIRWSLSVYRYRSRVPSLANNSRSGFSHRFVSFSLPLTISRIKLTLLSLHLKLVIRSLWSPDSFPTIHSLVRPHDTFLSLSNHLSQSTFTRHSRSLSFSSPEPVSNFPPETLIWLKFDQVSSPT